MDTAHDELRQLIDELSARVGDGARDLDVLRR